MDVDDDDIKFLSNHLASGSRTGYGYVFARFCAFCDKFLVDPFTCSPAIIVKYLRQLYESGSAYNTVNHHRSSISKFHQGYGGQSAGSHPLVSKAVKAVFRLRPPLPKYKSTFDITKVFAFLQSLPVNSQLSLKQFSFKMLFLLPSATISRVSSVVRLGASILFHQVWILCNCNV